MKKWLTAVFIALNILAYTPTKTEPITIDRDTGLVITGILLTAGGVYNLCKESETWLGTIARAITGITLIGLGSTIIVSNKHIIGSADDLRGALRWKKSRT